MALFPCSHCHARYRGPQRSLYPALVKGGTTLRLKQRLCQPCFNRALTWAAANLQTIADAEQFDDARLCFTAGPPHDADWAVFVTAYDQGSAETSFYGMSCEGHLAEPQLALFGPAEPPQTAFSETDAPRLIRPA